MNRSFAQCMVSSYHIIKLVENQSCTIMWNKTRFINLVETEIDLVFKQATQTTQPGYPYIDRHNE